jgi:hypothetical protein
MIRYRLVCSETHEFEGWFRNSDAFQRQSKRGQVECPECGSRRVKKAPMAPSVARRDKGERLPREVAPAQPPVAVANAAGPGKPEAAARRRELMAMMRKLRAEVIANSEDVGDRFPEEARKIHYQEVEARSVHGEASPSEVKELLEEGIEIYPIPELPEEHN